MAQNRPNKPSVTLPDNFGGVKNEFSSTKISNGYESSTPEIVEGGNLNYMLDGLFQNTKYMRTVLDYVRDTPVGKMFWVNSSGQMDYIQPAIIATNVEFNTGTATDKTPNVKQVVDKLETKANNNSVVHLTGNETIGGTKTFRGSGEEKIHIQNTDVTYDTAPLSSENNTIAFVDKNDYGYGIVQSWRYTDNSTFTLISSRSANNTWPSTALGIGMKADGTAYALCPTPLETTSTSSYKIANVGWTNTRINNILAALYPVGSIYIGTQSTCPLASLISGSTWTLVGKNRALWGANSTSNANTTIAAGLPNITGSIDKIDEEMTCTGAFYQSDPGSSWNVEGTSGSDRRKANFDASRVSSIYGNSSTVQPPAYVVNVWRRTA